MNVYQIPIDQSGTSLWFRIKFAIKVLLGHTYKVQLGEDTVLQLAALVKRTAQEPKDESQV